MMDGRHSCKSTRTSSRYLTERNRAQKEFLLTAAGQKNRNHLEQYVRFENVSFGMEEVLYDPQTSGGLLFAVPGEVAEELCGKLRKPDFRQRLSGK